MSNYGVIIASSDYRGQEELIYSSSAPLRIGSLVRVSMRNKTYNAVVTSLHNNRVAFDIKPITDIIDHQGIGVKSIRLAKWISEYYGYNLASSLQPFIPSYITNKPAKISLKPVKTKGEKPPTLTPEQKKICQQINSSVGTSFLLRGITGSGKTRVYVELAQKALNNNQSVIILTPEIGLTPQLIAYFERYLPGKITIQHSHQAIAERKNNWFNLLNNPGPHIVIGPRSALFLPVSRIGLIVLDESHDDSYKQEQSPKYHAAKVAATMAKLHGAKLILASATPAVEDFFAFKTMDLPVLTMTKPATKGPSQITKTIVDLKDYSSFTKSRILSDQLIDSISQSFRKNKLSLVYLNRRGTAKIAFCKNCGWVSTCPNCDITLTYHGDTHNLICHICSYKMPAPSSCPECNHTDVSYRTHGTKALEAELKKLFPAAKIYRFDSDQPKKLNLESSWKEITGGKVDIIMGTQMITKGMDLPKLETVGIINADTSLSLPDYKSEEKTFQQINQIKGRLGRGHGHGNLIVQTYKPDSQVLSHALNDNYQQFMEDQLAQRQQFNLPPYCYILKIRASRKTDKSAINILLKLKDEINSTNDNLEIKGPAPNFHYKLRGKYNWQLIIKSKKRSYLLEIIKKIPSSLSYDIDPISLL